MDQTTWIALAAPLVLLEVVLKIVALVSLKRAEKTRGPKALWAVLILLTTAIGWILWFVVGRDEG